jgi:SAM-dependent methyltransferase
MVEKDERVFEDEETIKSWDEDYYHPIAEKYYDRAIPTMLALMGAEPGATVLDAGCGPGVHTIRAARAGFRVCAADRSQAMLREAQRRVERAGMADRVEFRREDLTNLSFPDASFDYVFSWGVIIHIREIDRALDELARIVKPAGKLALYVTNNTAWDHKIESFVRFLVRKPHAGFEDLEMGRGCWYEMHGEKLWVWLIDASALTRALQARGFVPAHRVIGELTEIQRRTGGVLRRALLYLNTLCYALKLPAYPSAANLLIFEKTAGSEGPTE